MNLLPILNNSLSETPIFWFKNELVTHEKFKLDVLSVAENLTQHKYAINLCEDRYLFAVAFVASMIQKHVCLMPAHRAEKEIAELEKKYSDTQRLDDQQLEIFLNNTAKNKITFPLEINSEQLVAIVFTSGSSGKPKANHKKWGALFDSAQRVATQLKLNHPTQHTLIATVPPQHMYGFETTIIFPLVTGVCVHNSKPFFPEDIRQTLNAVKGNSILVTTPIHLRACSQASLEWPTIDFILCATAPLSVDLAHDAEQQLQTKLYEIYGCSEAGVIATRKTTQDLDWLLLEDYKLSKNITGVCLITPVSNEEILLSDQIEFVDSQTFRLLGRQSDLIKIAGKRGSLNDLKIKICAMEGIDDAVFFMPDENPDEKARLAAFVVAPNLSIKEINSFLSPQIDNAFMPRPLIKVKSLPYNETGKLLRKNLVNLFIQNRSKLKNSA